MASLAYPGTACISDWTTACTTTLTLESAQTFVQTWCCPPGSYSCLTAWGEATPWRDCVRLLSTPTEVWVNNIATSGGTEKTLWSSWRKVSLSDLPSSGPLSVKHPVFPLYGHAPFQSTNGTNEAGLATGAIAGIVVGAVVLALLLLGGGVFVCLRKRKQKRAALAAQSDINAANDGIYYKGMGYDTKQELPGHGPEAREVDAAPPPPVELAAYTRAAEVEGSRPAELS